MSESKKTWTNPSSDTLLQFVQVFLTQTLFIETPYPKSQLPFNAQHILDPTTLFAGLNHSFIICFLLCLSEFIREPGSNQGQEKKFKNSEC